MWYEILPSAMIMVAALSVPSGVTYVMNKLVLDHAYRRSLSTPFQNRTYLRDTRVGGSPYAIKGLEEIPE